MYFRIGGTGVDVRSKARVSIPSFNVFYMIMCADSFITDEFCIVDDMHYSSSSEGCIL